MAEEVMFDAAVWNNGGFSHANFFLFEHLMLILAHGYSFQIVAWSRKAFPGRPTWGERKANFFLHFFGKKHFCWTDFFETYIRAITQSIPFFSNKNQVFIPLPSWCSTDDATDKQADNKGPWTSSRLHLVSVIVIQLYCTALPMHSTGHPPLAIVQIIIMHNSLQYTGNSWAPDKTCTCCPFCVAFRLVLHAPH